MPLHPYPLSFVVADFFIAAHIIFYALIKYEGVPLHPYPLSFVVADFFIAAHIIFYAVIKYEGVPLHPYPLSFVVADFFVQKKSGSQRTALFDYHYFSFLESSCSSCSYCEKPSTDFISSSSTCSS